MKLLFTIVFLLKGSLTFAQVGDEQEVRNVIGSYLQATIDWDYSKLESLVDKKSQSIIEAIRQTEKMMTKDELKSFKKGLLQTQYEIVEVLFLSDTRASISIDLRSKKDAKVAETIVMYSNNEEGRWLVSLVDEFKAIDVEIPE